MTYMQNNSRVAIFDTTLRDGDQAPGFALTADEKIKMAHALAAMGVDVIEAGFPISSSLDFRAVKAIANSVQGPRIAALARASGADIECAAAALENCQRPRIHTFIATSPDHMKHKLMMTPQQVLEKIGSSVSLASDYMKARGDVEWSAEDASRSSIDFLVQAVRVAIEAGATTINLPDTVGYATPDEYANMFRQVIAQVQPGPEIVFSAHVHNDLGLAVANSLAALSAGVRQIECTIKGIGERAGNAQLEAVVAAMQTRRDQYPYESGVDMRHFKPVADFHSRMIGQPPSYLPVVGDNAFAHGSGIHQDGTIKCNGYEIMIPQECGHEGTQYSLTRHSGMAGVEVVLAQHWVTMSGNRLIEFMKFFKEEAGRMLEEHKLRIVPPEMAVRWAQSNSFGNESLPLARM